MKGQRSGRALTFACCTSETTGRI